MQSVPAEPIQQQRRRQRLREEREYLNRDMNSEFVPKLQTVAGFLSLLNSSLLLAVGGAFLVLPRWVLSVLLDYQGYSSGLNSSHHADPIDGLARLIGSVLIAQGLACLVLMYPMIVEGFSSAPPSIDVNQTDYSQLAIWNVRTSVTLQLLTGLFWIAVSLYDDRGNDALYNEALFGGVHRRSTFGLLLVGFGIFILGCLSMMMTFWPAANLDSNSLSRRTITRGENQDSAHENHDLTEPLLSQDAGIQNSDGSVLSQGESEVNSDEDFTSQGGSEDGDANDLENNPSDGNPSDEENDTDEPTSRIRGTQRLLAMAAPQVIYLYIGCIVLLIRLPFSLSIPHFVSTTLGSLADGEYDRARREIIWLFILGTIDALLDFWCIFCKSGN